MMVTPTAPRVHVPDPRNPSKHYSSKWDIPMSCQVPGLDLFLPGTKGSKFAEVVVGGCALGVGGEKEVDASGSESSAGGGVNVALSVSGRSAQERLKSTTGLRRN